MGGSIRVSGLGKRFRRYGANRARSIKEVLVRGFGSPPEYFWGLRGIDLVVPPGRAVGVVGKNGAGKSTLLRLVGGVGRPDEGHIEVEGRIGALLDIGSGLSDELTGRENAFVAGVIAGMRRTEVQRRFDEIVAFAELEDFIDSPLRTYSTGMRMRLAFAVAAHIDPDILLIDEVLAVGDMAFQRKCLARVSEIKDTGCTILLVSHDQSQINAICDDVLFLKQGQVVAFGPVMETMAMYEASTQPDTAKAPVHQVPDIQLSGGYLLRQGMNRFGSLEAEIIAVRLLNPQGVPVSSIVSGAGLVVEMDYRLGSGVERLIASVGIYLPDGTTACFDMNTSMAELKVPTESRWGTIRLRIERLDLVGGEYFVHVGLFQHDWEYSYDTHERAYSLKVVGTGTGKGILSPPLRWSVSAGVDEGPKQASSG